MIELKDKDYKNFQKVLEYFVAVLEVYAKDDKLKRPNKNKQEADEIGPEENDQDEASSTTISGNDGESDLLRGIWTDDRITLGKGYQCMNKVLKRNLESITEGQKLQKYLYGRDICKFGDDYLCITTEGGENAGGHRIFSRSCYIHWLGTHINIIAEWDNDYKSVKKLYITGVDHGKDATKYKVKDLGLFSDDDPDKAPNTLLKRFFNEYYNLAHFDGVVQDSLEREYNVILTGAPGTGKTYTAHEVAAKMLGCKSWDDLIKNKKNLLSHVGFVQFHPSYDYTDFVEGLRPCENTHEGNNNTPEDSTNTDKKYDSIGFELTPGIFKTFCEKALEKGYENSNGKYSIEGNGDLKANEDQKPYIFIIDEINRGEMSKIFGELFFSIDPGYRGRKGKVQTQYANMEKGNEFDNALDNGKKGQFFIPENVYIIGTMNDIDRSVESMDFAMRRRFAWKEVFVEDSLHDILTGLTSDLTSAPKWMQITTNSDIPDTARKILNDEVYQKHFKKLNDQIKILKKSDAYCLGGSYLTKIMKAPDWCADVDDALMYLWDSHLKNVVYEYFRGEHDVDNIMRNLEKKYM